MIAIIANPTSGRGRGKKIAQRVGALLTQKKIEYTLSFTEAPGDGEPLARQAVENGADLVLSVGGDGSTLEVARGLFGSQASLGIIPAGTGNDFIRSLHIPSKPAEALEYALNRSPRPVDVGTVNGKLFLNVCGFGFDVSVLDYSIAAKRYVKGLLPYLWGVLRTILHPEPIHATVELDGKEVYSGDMLVCAIANGSVYGGGIPIAPESSVNDGLFDVLILKYVPSRLKLITYLPGLLKGKATHFDISTLYRAKKVHLHPQKMRVNVDGDVFTMEQEDFELHKDALLVRW